MLCYVYLLGWAHVVCALYVPEVAFGDVSTMEPILVSKVSRDKYGKACLWCVLLIGKS